MPRAYVGFVQHFSKRKKQKTNVKANMLEKLLYHLSEIVLF